MAAHRKFLHVSNLRRAGYNFPVHPTDVLPGDQALECVACPRPGWNFEWSEVIENERYVTGSYQYLYACRLNSHLVCGSAFSLVTMGISAVSGKSRKLVPGIYVCQMVWRTLGLRRRTRRGPSLKPIPKER